MRRIILMLVVSIFAVSSLHAAAVLQQKIVSRGFGPKNFGASEGTTTLRVQDGKGHLTTESELTGKVLKRFAPKTVSLQIGRPDLDLSWFVNEKAGHLLRDELPVAARAARADGGQPRGDEG